VIENCTARGANWFCVGGQCINLPPEADAGEGEIQVSPARVRSGETTMVTWNSEGFSSCQVTENNLGIDDAWSGLSGMRESSPIGQRTTYLLRCDGINVDTATVNMLK
jgi:hypothetical protein